jgi:hypothetical protein
LPTAWSGGPAAHRGRLLKANLRRANAAYRAALRAGAEDPIVVIAEVDDPKTGRFSADLLRNGAFFPACASEKPPGRPVVVLPAERPRARTALCAFSAAAVEAVEARRTDGYLAVVAGAGDLTFTLVSLPRNET